MKIILLQDIRGVGKRHEIKDVSDGYARNQLIPKRLARIATAEALAALREEHKADTEALAHLEAIKRDLESRSLTFEIKVGASREVFESITKDKILSALRDAKFVTKERVEIKIERPLRELGAHEIEVNLSHGIRAKMKIILQPQP